MDLSSEQPARVGKKYNVLIIDDDAGTRETYEGLDLGGLLSVVRAGLKDSEAGPASITPRSVVERMVAYVVKVLDSHGDGANGDFKTIDEWAKRVGVSYSTLCETCRLLGIRPLDARDFARVLSALRASTVHLCPPEVFLNVSSRRVLRAISTKAGVDLETIAEQRPIDVFFARQRFIAQGNRALHLIRAQVDLPCISA